MAGSGVPITPAGPLRPRTMASPSKKEKKPLKTSVVDHTYRDYSRTEITDIVDSFTGINEDIFPAKLHEILSTPKYAGIIGWRPHGRAWMIEHKKAFVKEILPQHFNHGNYESFNRSASCPRAPERSAQCTQYPAQSTPA